MFRSVKNAAAVVAAFGLVLAQPAMATRSTESLPSATAKIDAKRVGSKVTDSEQLQGLSWIAILIALGVAIGVLVQVSDNQNDSPG